ncbi:MAG: hypothetical protein PHC86_05195 [Eubacteriales bacterium]|nr:hypothetical protein [Eubacteriales bacterium]
MRLRISLILIILGLLVALLPLTTSGAISLLTVDRSIGGNLTLADLPGLVELQNFDNQTYQLTSSYKTVGTIINNASQTMKIKMTTTLDDSQITNTKWQINVRANGGTALTFSRSDNLTQTTKEFQITAGSSKRIEAKENSSVNGQSIATYSFAIISADGTYTQTLADSSSNPIRHIFK